MNNAPIGVFDSGLGGLTVARAIIDKLPDEEIVYLGDTANTPYGPRPISEVRELTLAGLDVLVKEGVKMIVLACNTATAAALTDARERYATRLGIPIIEVITPAAGEAAIGTRNKNVGIIGTATTVSSEAYPTALAAVPGLSVQQSACPRFVEFVERGETTGPELTRLAREYLAPLKAANCDTVILGCTHYPLLTGVISREMGPNVLLVSSSEATANATYSKLIDLDLLHSQRGEGDRPNHRFLTTKPSEQFGLLARRFLGPEVAELELAETEVLGVVRNRGEDEVKLTGGGLA